VATLTDKTRAILAELFTDPDQERSARDIGLAAGVAPNVAGNLLGRLINHGYVLDRRTNDGTRMFRIAPKKRAEAADAAGVVLPQPAPAPAPTAPQPPVRRADDGVMTVREVREAHARGEVSTQFLAQVERAVAETVKNATRR
jgi:hypothetical protein